MKKKVKKYGGHGQMSREQNPWKVKSNRSQRLNNGSQTCLHSRISELENTDT